MSQLHVTSPCFAHNGPIPLAHTGYGDDRSPALVLTGLDENAVSLAVILNDMNHPIPAYTHWVIWNIPARPVIPGDIPPGEQIASPVQAVQGIGYGKHRYCGPKPPFHWSHVYHYNVYVLDCFLTLPSASRKGRLLAAMEGHILQQAVLAGHFR